MDIIKIWGSILAPKHQYKVVNHSYLEQFSQFINQYFQDQQLILIHGAGSYGHGFVSQYGLNIDNQHLLRAQMDEYFEIIDQYFPQFQRHSAEDVINHSYTLTEKTMTAWDVSSQATVISGDDTFAHYFKHEDIQRAFFLTDVPGVLDLDNNIIPEISQANIDDIHFWNKENDVTGSMEQKIKKLLDSKQPDITKTVRILHADNLENFKNILQTWEGTWTKIII